MVYWIFGILIVLIVAAIVAAVVMRPDKARSVAHRKRFALDADGQPRIPLAEERAPYTPAPVVEEAGTPIFEPPPPPASNRLIDLAREEAPTVVDEPEPPPPVVTGKIVNTPDGEMVITTPPFALRPQLFSRRVGRYYNGLTRRLPAWVVACPRMRLDSLVTPTPPDGRDPDDWTHWRKRVRMRALDIVICDRRSWKPLVAIMLDPPPGGRFARRSGSNGTTTALVIAGGVDRMIDEVLAHVGLPLIRGSGDLAADWPMIEPYINEAILKTTSEEELFRSSDTGGSRPDPDAAVTLLKMDADKGWLLE
jgi:hypothetical protein